jgi:hypothetical protein
MIDEVKLLLLGEGDVVLVAAKGTLAEDPCVYIDLYRVEGEKLVEHWGFMEKVPPPEARKTTTDCSRLLIHQVFLLSTIAQIMVTRPLPAR